MEIPVHHAKQIETSNFGLGPTLGLIQDISATSGAVADENLPEVQNNYRYIKGKLVLVNREPDGDSVAFIADNRSHFSGVYRDYLLKPSSIDGSVQLRFEGIDSPEIHYGRDLQPLSVEARDFLLKNILGFSDVQHKPSSSNDHPSTKVTGSTPESVPVIIATSGLETHGRPISYVFLDDTTWQSGTTAPLDPGELSKSVNYKMLDAGYAYLMAYTSMPKAHFNIFKQAANSARRKNLGVWEIDSTRDFVLLDKSSIEGLEAQLIYPVPTVY